MNDIVVRLLEIKDLVEDIDSPQPEADEPIIK